MEWISVKERLPEKDEEVIVAALFYETIASYNGETWSIDPYDGKKGISQKNITHWKPLAKSPDKERQG